MRIWTRATYDIETGRFEDGESYLYSGPVAEAKGQDKAKAQMDLQNQLQQQQLAQQAALRAQVMGDAANRGSIASYLKGGVGFDPALKAAMIAAFMNQNSQNFNQAGSQVRAALAARGAGGGDAPVGGDFTRGISSLEGAKASNLSQGVLGVNVQDAQQALANQFNAANVAGGQTAQIGQNVGTFGQGASDALKSYVTAANAPGFMQAFGNALGSGLADVATGGISGTLGGIQSVAQGKGFGKGFGSPWG